jgi:hypothetical protein
MGILGHINEDGFVRSRHPGENRDPENSYDHKTLDSGFRRNDGKKTIAPCPSIKLIPDSV